MSVSPELVIATGALVTAIGGVARNILRDRAKDALDAAKAQRAAEDAEAERIAARDRTQAEHAEWLRHTVESQIEVARADRERERQECNERIDGVKREADELRRHVEERDGVIDALREEIGTLRKLAERLAHLVAQIDPYKTPTAEQMDALRKTATDLGLRPSVAPSLVLARGGSK